MIVTLGSSKFWPPMSSAAGMFRAAVPKLRTCRALLVGPPGVGGKVAPLGQHGADLVLVCEHDAFARYARESVATTLAEVVTEALQHAGPGVAAA